MLDVRVEFDVNKCPVPNILTRIYIEFNSIYKEQASPRNIPHRISKWIKIIGIIMRRVSTTSEHSLTLL